MSSFTKQRQRELRKLMNRLPIIEGCQGTEKFLLEYVGFESVYRKVWHYYRCRNKTKSESHAGIPLSELKKACEYFNIDVEDSVLNNLLDSRLEKRNAKSARNLRNGIIHAWKQADCNEASKRNIEFQKYIGIAHKGVEDALKNS